MTWAKAKSTQAASADPPATKSTKKKPANSSQPGKTARKRSSARSTALPMKRTRWGQVGGSPKKASTARAKSRITALNKLIASGEKVPGLV